jgi:hypothetical protein
MHMHADRERQLLEMVVLVQAYTPPPWVLTAFFPLPIVVSRLLCIYLDVPPRPSFYKTFLFLLDHDTRSCLITVLIP